MLITLKAAGFIMVVLSFYIAGTIFESIKKKSIKDLSGTIDTIDKILNFIRCDSITIIEAMEKISNDASVVGQILRKSLNEYKEKKNMQLNEILINNLNVYKKESFIPAGISNTLEYLFERLGQNDLEYQVLILSETSDRLKAELKKMNEEYTKTKGLYIKSALCIGVITAVLFI